MKINWIEVAICIAGGLVLAVIAFLILNQQVSNKQSEANYYQTMRVANNKSEFEFMLRTNAGRTGVNDAQFTAKDSVSFPEIKGEHMYIERVKEHYTMKTRTYTTTDSKGNTQTHTEVYYEWDVVDRDKKKSDVALINGIETKTKSIGLNVEALKMTSSNVDLSKVKSASWFGLFESSPKLERDGYIYAGSNDRFYYNVVRAEFKSTIFVDLKDKQVLPLSGEKVIRLYSESVQAVKKNKNDSVETLLKWILPITIIMFFVGAVISLFVIIKINE